MSHCPGCGGHFKHGPHEHFKHILGCGWVSDKKDGRGAPSSIDKQRVYIEEGLEAAEKANRGKKVDAFIKAVLKNLDDYNPEAP